MMTSFFRFFRVSAWALLFLATAGIVPSASAEAPDEIRALWAQAWQPDLYSPAGIDQLIADARSGNFNTLFVQMRRRADTLYFSDIDPRISNLQYSSFDSLAYILQKAREQNPPIEIHAWIVVYPVDRGNAPPEHVTQAHPEWMTQTRGGSGTQRLDPGHPGVQSYLLDVAMELITKYDIDGLHYDYVRYEGNDEGYNPVTVQRFQQLHNRTDLPPANDADWSDFRRGQVTDLVRSIYLHAMAVRPEVKISASTITWSPGPANVSDFGSTRPYYDIMSNWPAWMEEGILDINVPMAYFRDYNTAQNADYTRWNNFIKDTRYNRHAVIGPGIYMNTLPASIAQMRETRETSPAGNHVEGVSGYTYHQVASDLSVPFSEFRKALTEPSQYDSISPPMFAEPAAIPEMPWKTNPTTGHLMGYVRNATNNETLDGATVHLSGSESRTIRSDATGFYGFVDLGPGNYSVNVEWQGETGDSEDVTISLGEVTEHDLTFILPPPTTGDLQGYVLETSKQYFLPNATVHLIGPVTASTTTNSEGFFSFPLLPPGNYTLHAIWFEPGYRAPETMVSIAIGETTSQNLHIFWGPDLVDREEFIVDDSDDAATLIGTDWRPIANSNGYGNGYLFTHNPSHFEYDGPHSVTFTPTLPEAGYYRIDTWYASGGNRSPNAGYTIFDGEEEHFITVNQTSRGAQWVPISGAIYLDPAEAPYVRIDNSGDGFVTMFDAVRWVALELMDPTHKVTATTVGEGHITGLLEDGIIVHGTVLNLEAIGENGYVFSHWSGRNAWGNSNPLSLPVGADLEIVAVFGSPWVAWLETHFSKEERDNPAIVAPDADPNGTGISNLLMFAFGIDPENPDLKLLPSMQTNETGILLQFRRKTADSGIEYHVDYSTDLTTWGPADERIEEVSTDDNDDGTETVLLRLLAEGDPRFFVKLRIEQN